MRHYTSDFSSIMGLRVSEHGPDARVVTVVGELDTVTAPELAAVLSDQLTAVRLVVDLDGVQFVSSAGLTVLFEAHELATRKDRVLRLVCQSPIVHRALAVTGLDQHFSFADTVSQALQDRP